MRHLVLHQPLLLRRVHLDSGTIERPGIQPREVLRDVYKRQVGGRPKDVFYWAAELPEGARALADEGEVDELRWVTTDVARELLTNQDDLAPLESLEALAEADALRTRPILIARHAKAKMCIRDRVYTGAHSRVTAWRVH